MSLIFMSQIVKALTSNFHHINMPFFIKPVVLNVFTCWHTCWKLTKFVTDMLFALSYRAGQLKIETSDLYKECCLFESVGELAIQAED
jgi:hypothetical protein